jgi:hypothetical protein
MNAFIVTLTDKPGELAKVTEALATKGIDITSFAGVTCGGDGTVALLTNDETGTRRALGDGGFRVRELEVQSASLENKPGTLAELTRKLADAGVNIECAIPTGMAGTMVTIAIATSDPTRARSLLGSKERTGVGMG